MKTAMFQSPEARLTMQRYHHLFRDRIVERGGVVEPRTIATSYGDTNLLVGGAVDAPPLVLIHGAMATSAHVLSELVPLLAAFRVYALDVVGQSPMSADARLPVNDDTYGRWLVEVLDGLKVAQAHVVGVSFGGFVAQRLACHAPERIAKLALLVPAGMVTGSTWQGITRMGWPMMRFMRKPTDDNLDRFVENLLSTTDDRLWRETIGAAFVAARMDNMRVPALTKPAELASFRAPTLVVAAEHDVSFPGERVLRRAPELFRGPLETELLKGAQHSPPTTDAFRAWMSARLQTFLQA
jgi:2-hydroxy-6-oxonona-2,4-dienedioate hydrolase